MLEVVEERTQAACHTLIEQALTKKQQANVTAVVLDRWKAYANAVEQVLPQAVIVHDKLHISQHLNEAIDRVRRKENKALISQGDGRLKGSKFAWLSNEENVSDKLTKQFNRLKKADLKVARAWAIKELFRNDIYAGCAERHFNQ